MYVVTEQTYQGSIIREIAKSCALNCQRSIRDHFRIASAKKSELLTTAQQTHKE